jgi:hypothetical protein
VSLIRAYWLATKPKAGADESRNEARSSRLEPEVKDLTCSKLGVVRLCVSCLRFVGLVTKSTPSRCNGDDRVKEHDMITVRTLEVIDSVCPTLGVVRLCLVCGSCWCYHKTNRG